MGYIKLNRKITEWQWFNDPEMLALWVHLLLAASGEAKEWEGEPTPRGTLVTSVAKLSIKTGISVSKVQNGLRRLKKSGEITTEGTNRWTKITIVNYDLYQKEDGKEEAQEQKPEPQPKEVVAPKPKPSPKKKTEDALVYPYCSQAFMDAWNQLRVQPKWKGKSAYAYQLSLNKLAKYDEEFAIELMMTAIERGWQGVVFSDTDAQYKEWLEKHPRIVTTAPAPNGKKYR